jgi:alkyldihydroxyacetonephosphate synthase
MLGADNVGRDDYQRIKYSHGKTAEEILTLRNGRHGPLSDLILHPRDRADVENIVRYCNDMKIPIYVYGGGSSVTLGPAAVKGGVTLVMGTYMNRMLDFNETEQTATVESGIMGPDYERLLNNAMSEFNAKRNYTCGHFPQSFEYSSVGGWIVTLGSGQQSSYYGDMCDIVLNQEYVTPRGTFQTEEYPATATGPKLNDIMKGSEGAFGVLTWAKLKIFHHKPENTRRFAFIFPDWTSTVDAAREISQGEFGSPSVFRISDPEETDIGLKLYGVDHPLVQRILSYKGFREMERCLFIGQSDGERNFAKNVKKRVKEICSERGAMGLTGLPVRKWDHGRYTDPYMREDLNDYGVIIDTLETSVTWSGIHKVREGVRDYVKKRPNTICMTHASHFYPQGTNLYFIFIAKMGDLQEYKEFQTGMIDEILRHGGSLSHHHGVGKMLAPWMESHLGSLHMDLLKDLKAFFDPNNIMNPGGSLGLDLDRKEVRNPIHKS